MVNLEVASQGVKQKLGQSYLFWKGLSILAVILSLFSLVLASSYKSAVSKNTLLLEALESKVLETEQKLAKAQQDTDKNMKVAFKALTDEIQSARSQVDQQAKILEGRVNQINALVQLQGVYGSIERAQAAILREGDYTTAADEVEKARNRLAKISEMTTGDQKANLQKLQQSLQELAVQLQNPTPSVTKVLGEIMDKLGDENNAPPAKSKTPASPGTEENPKPDASQKPEKS